MDERPGGCAQHSLRRSAPSPCSGPAATAGGTSIAPQRVAIVVFENKDYDASLDATGRRLHGGQRRGAVHQHRRDPRVALAGADAGRLRPSRRRARRHRNARSATPGMFQSYRNMPRVPDGRLGARVRVDGAGDRRQRPRPQLPRRPEPRQARGRHRRVRARPQRHVGAGVRPVRLHGGDRVSFDVYQEDYPGDATSCSTRQFSDLPTGSQDQSMFYARKHSPLLLTWSQSPDALVVNDGPGGADDLSPPAAPTDAACMRARPQLPEQHPERDHRGRPELLRATSSSAASRSSCPACATRATTRTATASGRPPTRGAASRGSTAGSS